ncbi:uncharacterized protein LOC142978821 [Anticarsia gemmatalis]|uniref:uncharacterized protein LOC142978821 n=1 Tax=Anticarsia gemmatalis TaxID=129554 RepID=UPI003F75CB09
MKCGLATHALAFAAFTRIACASYCNNITATYSPEPQYVSVFGESRPLSLYWGSGPARAASALLLVVLRYVLGYQNVRLRQGRLQLTELSREVGHSEFGNYDETIISLSAAWQPARSPEWKAFEGMSIGLAGPRLGEFGTSDIPVNHRLFVHLSNEAIALTDCTYNNTSQWRFYTDQNLLKLCSFANNAASFGDITAVKATVYAVETDENIINDLQARANASHLHLLYKKLDRASLFRMLRTSNASFLFIDFDMWSGDPHVSAVQLPPCTPTTLSCQQELDTALAMRVADVYFIQEFAPLIMQLAHNFSVSHNILRTILEQESSIKNITEVACKWAAERNDILNEWESYHGRMRYYVLVFTENRNHELLKFLRSKFDRWNEGDPSQILISIQVPKVERIGESEDNDFVKNKIRDYMKSGLKQKLIGAIVGGVKDITHVAKTLEGSSLPVILYEAADIDNKSTSVWSATGTSLQQALALNHFIRSMRWTRVAVLSEETDTAASLLKHLTDPENYGLRDHRVPPKLTRSAAINILKQVQSENAYIIFVNTNYEDAVTILLAAEERKMNGSNYAWIVRDWRPNNITKNITHVTISFSFQNVTDVSSDDGFKDLRESVDSVLFDNKYMWLTQTSAIVDAILTLVDGFQDVFYEHPSTRYDTHRKNVLQYFSKSLIKNSVQGTTQNLTYNGQSLATTVVFVDEWRGDRRELLERWRVNAASRFVRVEKQNRAAYGGKPPNDGASRCAWYLGDLYSATCYDRIWALALLAVIVMITIMMLMYRRLKDRLKKQAEDQVRIIQMKRDEKAALLYAFLVDRSALEQRHELGAGRFGCVRLTILRQPGKAPRTVAAKTLRNPEEESEILREACILACLKHEHIIGLVGVCIDDKPPVVLMEAAFFGDLRQYLQDRRYLIENAMCDSETNLDQVSEEASHVSAQALTQLARQAASALAYLSLRGVIHRDLRASNCLVDANRCLKLADFGMARETAATGKDGGTSYACRRRGLFPVLWMAPESLQQGVFSTASDVWALGVLVFELVTLGARPYGDMAPLRVMHFVAKGNTPPMPRDVTPQTNALAHLCWRRKPEERPTAAEVVAYLAERPYALRPALIIEHEEVDVPDSGYSDSPMSELLP